MTRELAENPAAAPAASSSAGLSARKVLAAGVRLPWRPIRWLLGAWQRSVQFRVVTGTLLLSSAVIIVVGWVFVQQVTEGLLATKVEGSLAEAKAGVLSARDKIEAWDPSEDLSERLTRLADDLSQRRTYDVLIDVDPGASDTVARMARSTDVSPESVPRDVGRAVQTGTLVWRYTTIRYVDEREALPGVVVGSQLRDPGTGAAIEIYYLFDLGQQAQTLALLNQSLIAVGVLVVALLGFVAWFVTRQVVTPVRMARRIAERLAAGLLDERMQVKGEDDLARLATSFNQMATSLQRQIRQLEELSRVQRRFVSDVSHELRTPLTTVRMAADMLYEARGEFDPGVRRSTELLQAELDRFEALLADLLEISRFDAGAAGLDLEDVDLRSLTRAVVDGARPLASRKGSRLELLVADDPCIAEVDPRRIERVVRNLVNNAIEYGEGRDITVRVAAGDGAAAVSVRDHGIGLKPGESAMVFERFWRADPARARTTGGTGLGLAIAMEDVLLHGGWLQAWGELGGGAHFRMTLPRRVRGPLERSPIPLVPPDRRPVVVRMVPAVGTNSAATSAPVDRTPDDDSSTGANARPGHPREPDVAEQERADEPEVTRP
ncbi:MAG TPA: MtrAB system histidine kinase MtrB [Actinopolymorphaceae bacterium]